VQSAGAIRTILPRWACGPGATRGGTGQLCAAKIPQNVREGQIARRGRGRARRNRRRGRCPRHVARRLQADQGPHVDSDAPRARSAAVNHRRRCCLHPEKISPRRSRKNIPREGRATKSWSANSANRENPLRLDSVASQRRLVAASKLAVARSARLASSPKSSDRDSVADRRANDLISDRSGVSMKPHAPLRPRPRRATHGRRGQHG
jgi:hypothetical protein